MTTKKYIRTFSCLLVALVVLMPQAALALPQSHKDAIDRNSVHYFLGDNGCTISEDQGTDSESNTTDFTNPVYKDGSTADPSAIRDNDGTYHIFATADNHLTSKDLVNWKKSDSGWNLRGAPNEAGGAKWGPNVAKIGSKYVLTYVIPTGAPELGGGGGSPSIGYAVADSINGPYEYKSKLSLPGQFNIGPQILVEGSRAWLIWGGGYFNIVEVELRGEQLRTIGQHKQLLTRAGVGSPNVTIESPWIHKHDGWYYLTYSQGHWDIKNGPPAYRVLVARSKNPTGPYEPNNTMRPILEGKDPIKYPGSHTIVTDENGSDAILYGAFFGDNRQERKLMLDQVSYRDGWPVVNDGHPSSGKQSVTTSAGETTTVCCPTEDGGTQNVTVTGGSQGSTAQQVFVFLIQKGLTAKQAAGIVGNLMSESGVGETKFDLDPKVTNEIGAYGIAQWLGGRKTALMNRANHDTLAVQMDFLWYELTHGYKSSTLDPIKASTDYTGQNGSVRIFLEHYEIPCNPGPACDSFYNTRKGYADDAYAAFKDLAPEDVSPSPGGCEGGSNGDAFIDSSGFAWPLVMPKSRISNGCKWPTSTVPPYCHHDGTPAFDLFAPVGTEAVAIADGSIASIKPYIVNGVDTGCQSIQYKDKNGWYYWYGHTRTDSRTPAIGAPMKAGDHISKVGESICAKGTSPHLHIDRGFPKGEYGGTDANRDPDFLKIMNDLYKNMP